MFKYFPSAKLKTLIKSPNTLKLAKVGKSNQICSRCLDRDKIQNLNFRGFDSAKS